jgi:hypothetical protein
MRTPSDKLKAGFPAFNIRKIDKNKTKEYLYFHSSGWLRRIKKDWF